MLAHAKFVILTTFYRTQIQSVKLPVPQELMKTSRVIGSALNLILFVTKAVNIVLVLNSINVQNVIQVYFS